MDDFVRDIRFAGRALRRTPGFTIGAVSSLALGLALTASTVAVVNAYLIRSLPYPAADRLYHVMYAPPGPWEPRGMTALDWKSVDDVVEFPITSSGETFYVMDGGPARSARGLRVTRSFIEGLGLSAVVGRSLVEDDFRAGSEQPALIGYGLWRDRFGSNADAIGRLLQADAETQGGRTETFRIVGVLPPDFYFGRDSREKVELLVPLRSPVRTYMVRLRPGVPAAVAERRITEAARSVASGLPPDWSGVHLESVHERYVTELRPVLIGIVVAVGLVLVIVCANVGVLVLLRTMRRLKEMAVRVALGSGLRHLVRMFVAEVSLLTAAALGIGIALTEVALGLLAPRIETELGRPAPGGSAAFALDSTVLLVVGGIGMVIAMSLAFLPLLTPWRHRVASALRRSGTTTTDGPSMRRIRLAMLAAEVAVTLILLVGSGSMIRSVVGMMRTDLGFQPERLVRSRVVLRGTDYADAPAFFRFYEELTERFSTVTNAPVVFTTWPPFVERPKQSIEIDGRVGHGWSAGAMRVGAGYFTAFGIELRSGRDFTRADVSGSELVAVISETLARSVWPDGGAVGRQVRNVEQTPAGPVPGPWRTVVGVAGDVRQAYGDVDLSDIYIPLSPTSFGRFGSFYLRTDRPPALLGETLRAAAAQLDPRVMIDQPRSVEGDNRQLAGTRFLTTMLSGFTVIAGFLAVLGIYAVTAYAAQQREREVAIRLALGAGRPAVVRLFLKDGAVVLAAGLGAGLLGAAAVASALENQLYGVRAFDPSILAATCSLLAAAGTAAAWWPARRASLRSPSVALKDG